MDTLVESKATLKTPAYAAQSAKAALAPWSIERREPGPHDVLIDTRTMEILDSSVGSPLDVGKYVLDGLEFVNSNPPSY